MENRTLTPYTMLQFTETQIAALEANKKADNAAEKAKVLRSRYARVFEFYSDPQLENWVKRQFDYFEHTSIDTQSATEQILDLFAVFGERFERCEKNDWALDILNSNLYDADTKAFMLQNEVARRYL
ncbi:hypothetical protein [Agaribacterium haliotis]|uniref:hypothetical protein n=1 Tax=Agaribacterium haliotis TaxID=2013869 RepID=UPI0011774837|nr:hypothetical protein [Agaribacterium haliotis]